MLISLITVPAIVFLILVLAVWYHRYRKRNGAPHSRRLNSRVELVKMASRYQANAVLNQTELNPQHIELGPKIGQGSFGEVHIAKYSVGNIAELVDCKLELGT